MHHPHPPLETRHFRTLVFQTASVEGKKGGCKKQTTKLAIKAIPLNIIFHSFRFICEICICLLLLSKPGTNVCVHWVKVKVNNHKTCFLCRLHRPMWLKLVLSCQPHQNLSVTYVLSNACIRHESAVFCLLFLSSFFIRTAFPFICILWMIQALILKEASLPIAPKTQHNNRATPGDSGGLYRRNMTAPDVTLYLGCGDIFSSAWMLTLKIGAMFWQGPHHVAVKSTTTNLFPAFFRALSKADCRERRKSWFSFQTGMTYSFLLRFTEMGDDES